MLALSFSGFDPNRKLAQGRAGIFTGLAVINSDLSAKQLEHEIPWRLGPQASGVATSVAKAAMPAQPRRRDGHRVK